MAATAASVWIALLTPPAMAGEPVLTPAEPAAGAGIPAATVVGGVTLAPRVALRQDGSFAPGVPDAALDAPGDPYAEGSPSLPDPAAPPHADGGVALLPAVTRDDYRRAYHAVPYSRAEHLANPSYRHEAAMKLLTGEYPPAKPVAAGRGGAFSPAVSPYAAGIYGTGLYGGGFGGLGYGFGRGVGYGPGGLGGLTPAAGFPGLITNGGLSGPSLYGPPPFAFDRIQGALPTFVNRYRPPGVFLPAR